MLAGTSVRSPVSFAAARDTATPIVAKEAEFRCAPARRRTATAPELFFCRDLEGYGWCVPQGRLPEHRHRPPRPRRSQPARASEFIDVARASAARQIAGGLVHVARPRVSRRRRRTPGRSSVLVCCSFGDAAGLAYPQSGEGIKPAIESGRLAARVFIEARFRLSLFYLQPYASFLNAFIPACLSRPPPCVRRGCPLPCPAGFSDVFTLHFLLYLSFLLISSALHLKKPLLHPASLASPLRRTATSSPPYKHFHCATSSSYLLSAPLLIRRCNDASSQ